MTIGGFAGLTAFANYTDSSGQKIFFWGGNNGIYMVIIIVKMGLQHLFLLFDASDTVTSDRLTGSFLQ